MSLPIATASFVLPGSIVGKNVAYRAPLLPDGSFAPYRVLTGKARAFKKRVADLAFGARLIAREWPSNCWQVAHVRITWQAFNDRHDVDARVLVQDAMSGVFYYDDRVVTWGETSLPTFDDGGPRTIITLELLAVNSLAAAEEKQQASLDRKIARARRKKTPGAPAKRFGRTALPPHILAKLIPS